jgi:hypothetical protein
LPNRALPSGEGAPLISLEPSQLLDLRFPNRLSARFRPATADVIDAVLAQYLPEYSGPDRPDPQQSEFAFGNDQSLLALRSIRMFTADCGCQPIYLGGDPRIAVCDDCETVAQSIATDPELALGCSRARASSCIPSIRRDLAL